ncbi:phosphatase PAP2 family protein [Actinoplanes sp. LDG1-06]|uniref:Phosphatase PAP2 family protein n=1 Tax=Paractinoplanes ovalisporus TaxID=2810368 RepID=A0ABS2AQE2_9ACTN|nr:phosphatase PAP2 family protein [Actinoplanes ovalisporus]MBM2622094.1 phosphatase PAP2 family protein [Actinoplanes ovalisporus]
MTDDKHVVERAGWAPVRHFAERSVAGLAAVVLAGLAFGTLLLLVRSNWSPLRSLDQSIAERMNDLVAPHPAVVKVITTITSLGGRGVLIPLVTMVVVWLLIRRRPRLAIYLAVTGLGAMVLDPSLKALVGRVRPVVADPVAFGGGNSFPSGHTLGTTIVYGSLALVLLSATRGRWKGWILGVAALVIVAVGLTRIALSVHFLSDVLAGWMLGLAWISVTAYAFRVWRREAGHPVPAVTDGLEPEASDDLAPAPAEEKVLPHPWAKGAEILVGWVFTFGILYFVGYALTKWTPGTAFGSWDEGVNRWLQTFRTERLDDLSWLASKAGDTHAILIVCLVFCPLALALWRQWRPVLFIVLTMVGEITLFLTSAAAVGRPRPPVEQLDGQMPTSSFPSGHIAATMCLWVAIAVVSMPRVRQWWRWVFPVLAVLMPALVALSRMYRGMHHPTDVMGATLLTACWVGALYWIMRPNEKPETVSEAAEEAAVVAEHQHQHRPVAA